MAQEIVLPRGRHLLVCASGDTVSVSAPFSTLMPAFDAAERSEMESLALGLVAKGCAEFCCIGPEAELLHDGLDYIVEDHGALDVLTTAYTDETKAFVHLLLGSGGGTYELVAMTGSHSELSARLVQEALSLK